MIKGESALGTAYTRMTVLFYQAAADSPCGFRKTDAYTEQASAVGCERGGIVLSLNLPYGVFRRAVDLKLNDVDVIRCPHHRVDESLRRVVSQSMTRPINDSMQ